MARNKNGKSIIGLAVLFLGIVAGVFLVQNPQIFSPSAAGGTRVCRQVPRGKYLANVTGDGMLSWKLDCLEAPNRKGNLKLNQTIDLGEVKLPRTIKKGDRVSGSTTLDQLCGGDVIVGSKGAIRNEWADLCAVCKIIECKNITLSADIVVDKLACKDPKALSYTVSGGGTVSLSGKNVKPPYEKGRIGIPVVCSIQGTAEGTYDLELSKDAVKLPGPTYLPD